MTERSPKFQLTRAAIPIPRSRLRRPEVDSARAGSCNGTGPPSSRIRSHCSRKVKRNFLKNIGLSRPLFGFSFSFFLGHCKITIGKFYNGKWWWETWKEKEEYTVLLHIIRKNLITQDNRLTTILNWKSLSLSWDSNLAYQDRMPSLYHLCHHHFPSSFLNLNFDQLIHWG